MTQHERSSRLSGFYKLPVEDRLRQVQRFAGLTEDEVDRLRGVDLERLSAADKMIENVGGLFHLPVGFAANFRIDGHDVLVPMVIEEPSVVAASSNAARMMRGGRGIVTETTAPIMIGQIQLCDVPDLEAGRQAILADRGRLIALANEGHSRLIARGGGARDLEVRVFPETEIGPMLVVHLYVDVCDAMGANLVNAMAERLAPEVEDLSGGGAFLRILSNLSDRRLVTVEGRIPFALLDRPSMGWSGAEVAERVVRASVFAEVDPYRAATHNKGIMNGVDAFLLATGQDWRAVEAGAHAYAARDGHYGAMAVWRIEGDALVGRMTMPMQVGVVGGVTKVHPVVRVLLKVVEARTAADIGRIAVSVGLAQNLAAILALATEGIQRGHMSLHARNIAAAVGARDDQIDRIVAEMIRRRTISHDAAELLLDAAEQAPETKTEPLTIEELQAMRDRNWPQIEALIERVVPRPASAGNDAATPGDGAGEADAFGDMFWYAIGTGGKRLRAVLPLVVFEAFGGDAEEAIPFAAAMELLHNATLIHKDTIGHVRSRRGADTVWVRYGVDQAIQIGDAMLFAALDCLQRLERPSPVVSRLQRLVTTQTLGILRAQVNATHLVDGGHHDGDAMVELLRDRTGGLFRLSVMGGAVLAQAHDDVVQQLARIGDHLGVMFQVQDELLGIVGGFSTTERGAAIRSGEAGILLHHCLRHATPEAREELATILAKHEPATGDRDVLRAIELLRQTGSLRHGVELLERTQRAIDAEAAALPQTGLVRLLAGIGEIFLAPLIDKLER